MDIRIKKVWIVENAINTLTGFLVCICMALQLSTWTEIIIIYYLNGYKNQETNYRPMAFKCIHILIQSSNYQVYF